MSVESNSNTLQQDLFLIAKNRYGEHFDRAEAARIACAHHILHAHALMSHKDTIFWVMKEFVHTGIILNTTERLTSFMLDLGKFSVMFGQGASENWVKTYHLELLNGLLSEIATTQVYKDDVNLMPFPIPQPSEIMRLVLANAGLNVSEQRNSE